MMPPKRMRKKTRNEISTGLKRAVQILCKNLAFDGKLLDTGSHLYLISVTLW
jgi:hypothetical protein